MPIPSSPGALPFPTVAERRLLERLPSDVAADCVRGTPSAGGAGGTVSLVCQPALGTDADRVWFDEFDPEDVAKATFFRLVEAESVPPGDCEAAAPALDRWQIGADLGGERACYLRDGHSWIRLDGRHDGPVRAGHAFR